MNNIESKEQAIAEWTILNRQYITSFHRAKSVKKEAILLPAKRVAAAAALEIVKQFDID